MIKAATHSANKWTKYKVVTGLQMAVHGNTGWVGAARSNTFETGEKIVAVMALWKVGERIRQPGLLGGKAYYRFKLKKIRELDGYEWTNYLRAKRGKGPVRKDGSLIEQPKSRKPKRKTILRSELVRLSVVNSVALPSPIEMDGQRMRWVGIGWVDEGPAEGNETLLVEDE